MDYSQKIRNRIRERRYRSINHRIREEGVVGVYPQRNEHRITIISILSPLLVILSLVLGVLIYAKKDEEANFLQQTLGIQYNFSSLNQQMSSLLAPLLDYDIFRYLLPGNDQNVGSEPDYILVSKNYYTNDSNSVIAISGGVVLYVEEDEDSGESLVIIQHDGGFIASYCNVLQNIVEPYDRVEQGNVIGMFDQHLELIFQKGRKQISYEEALELS